jgi:ribonuclease P protein component
VVVAKKSIPLAVDRNRAKRLARELFRTDPAALPAGWELVLIARPSMLRKPLADLRRIYAVAVAGAVSARSGPTS